MAWRRVQERESRLRRHEQGAFGGQTRWLNGSMAPAQRGSGVRQHMNWAQSQIGNRADGSFSDQRRRRAAR